MVHPPVILRQAGEYVHFAWFPSSIFQTSPELGVTQLETGFRRSSNTNGRVGPDDTITLFSMNTSANMFGGGSAGQAPRLLCKMRWCKQADWLSSQR